MSQSLPSERSNQDHTTDERTETPSRDAALGSDRAVGADRGENAAREAGRRDREAIEQASKLGQTGQRPSGKDSPPTPAPTPAPSHTRPSPQMSVAKPEAKADTTPGRDAGQAARRAGAETADGAELTKPATERQVDDAVKESFPASDPTSTQREKPGAGDAPPDLRHRLPPTATDAEREAVQQVRDGE